MVDKVLLSHIVKTNRNGPVRWKTWIQDQFVLNLIHRPEMVPEYAEKVTGHGKTEDIGRKALLTESLDIFKTQQEAAHKNGLKVTIQMTYAVREFSFDGEEFHEGKILGLKNGKIVAVDDSREECMKKIIADIEDPSFITVFYGEDVDENGASAMETLLRDHYGDDVELTVVSGGQPLYDYVISAE